MIYILLPIYNEENSISPLLSKIKEVMEANGYSYKIIAVDDGSKDKTAGILGELSQKMPIELITHKMNRGLGETARDAFEAAAEESSNEDIMVRMDSDDTHDPKYIPGFIKKINDGYDVVIASRFQKGGGMLGVNAYRSAISYFANFLIKLFFWINGVRDYSCGFRAYRAKVIKNAINIYGNDFIELKGMGFTGTVEKIIKLKRMGVKITEIPFQLRYDQKIGKSKMVTSITTLGYLIVILKNIYPWGSVSKKWDEKIKKLSE